MSSTKTLLILAAVLALATLFAGLVVVLLDLKDPNEATGPRGVEPSAPTLADARAVPPADEDLDLRIQDLIAARRYAEAAREYPVLLDRLGAAWGKDSEKLIPHACRYLETLRLAGQAGEANDRAQRLLERWPDSIRILYSAAGSRAALARARREIDRDTDEIFERLLSSRNLARLGEVGLDPLATIAAWGETLLGLSENEKALAVANRGVKLSSDNKRCVLLRARALLALSRHSQAVEVLETLAERENSPGDGTYFLGVAFQEAKDPERAWRQFARIIEPGGKGITAKYQPGQDWRAPGSELRLRAARALADLGRYPKALELLVQPGILGLETAEVLELAERCARGLEAPAVDALLRRRRELAGVEALRRQSEREGERGSPGAEQLFKARAFFLVDQIGPGQIALQLGTVRAPMLLTLQLDQTMVYAALGRIDRGVSLLQGIGKDYPADGDKMVRLARSLLLARLARLQASRGRRDEAASALAEVIPKSRAPEAEPSLDPNVTYEVIQVYLELGDVARADALLPSVSVLPLSDLHRLCAAEIALRQGKMDEAGRLVAGGAGSHHEGRAWAGALRACITILKANENATRNVDPSDFLDHPRLIRFLLESQQITDASRRDLERWSDAIREREKIGPPLKEPIGSDASLERWGQLVALYESLGAHRKRREVGWFLVAWVPDHPEVNLWLARSLWRDEEVLPRLAAALRGLGAIGADEQTRATLQSIAERSKREIGLASGDSK